MEVLEEDNPNDVQISKFVRRVPNDKRKIIFEALLNYNVERKEMLAEKRIQISPDEVSRIPLNRRTTIRSMATALNMSKTSLHRRVKEGSLKSHSNAIKPLLTEENRKVRLQFCISMIDSNSPPHNPSFIDMYDRVHIDEKWFFLSKSSQKYYLLPDEDEPYRTCKSKKFIAKVMFLCAVARPRFDSGRNEMFDGKIGIFPFIYKEAAKRRSKNREAGTLVTKPIESVNKEVTRKWLIDYVLPAIRAKWPLSSSKSIFIQQDNARPHISVNDAEFLEAAQKDGFDIRLTCQPPNSPDMNEKQSEGEGEAVGEGRRRSRGGESRPVVVSSMIAGGRRLRRRGPRGRDEEKRRRADNRGLEFGDFGLWGEY
nr:uncharacterized protein LOC109190808 isoform X1 [Ipomoea trifida]